MKSSKKFYAFLLHVALSDESSFMELLIKWSLLLILLTHLATINLGKKCFTSPIYMIPLSSIMLPNGTKYIISLGSNFQDMTLCLLP